MLSYAELYVDSSRPFVLWNDWNMDRQVYFDALLDENVSLNFLCLCF